jgi:hypothetical protein
MSPTTEFFENFERQAGALTDWARKAPRGARVHVAPVEKSNKPWWKFWG